jgi:hypothetical protein
MKGVEGIPLKYIIMLLVAIIVAAAFMFIANLLLNQGIETTQATGNLLNQALDIATEDLLNPP